MSWSFLERSISGLLSASRDARYEQHRRDPGSRELRLGLGVLLERDVEAGTVVPESKSQDRIASLPR